MYLLNDFRMLPIVFINQLRKSKARIPVLF